MFEPEEYKTWEKGYVVCLDKLGKDEKYPDEKVYYVLKTVQEYIDRWEQVEKNNLKQDVERLLKQKEKDRVFVELEINRA